MKNDTLYFINRACESDFTHKELDDMLKLHYTYSKHKLLKEHEIRKVSQHIKDSTERFYERSDIRTVKYNHKRSKSGLMDGLKAIDRYIKDELSTQRDKKILQEFFIKLTIV